VPSLPDFIDNFTFLKDLGGLLEDFLKIIFLNGEIFEFP
jgi:hypothetical protein